MFGNKKGKAGKFETLIGEHTTVTGDIRFSNNLHIDGTVSGNVIASNGEAALSLSETGVIEGKVDVPYAILNGMIQGDVYSRENIELGNKARVTGNVYYNLVEVTLGAEVNGKLVHTNTSENQYDQMADTSNIPAEID